MVIVEKVNYKNLFDLVINRNTNEKFLNRVKFVKNFIPEIKKLNKAEKQDTLLNRQHFMVKHKINNKTFIDGLVGIYHIEQGNRAELDVLSTLEFNKVDYLVEGAKIIVNDYCIDKWHLNELYSYGDFNTPMHIAEFWKKFGYDSADPIAGRVDMTEVYWFYRKMLNNKEKTY